MLEVSSLEHFFKPEVRKQGSQYFEEEAVFLSVASDTSISGIIKASPPIRITFISDSISDAVFKAACSCAASAKGQLCKHIWATILTAVEKHPDFFDSKTEIVKVENAQTAKLKPKVSPSQEAFKSQLKAKQSDYRKQQYQKIKSEKKAKKALADAPPRPQYSDDVETALKYFADNGFEMGHPISSETLKTAKKVLSRVFHPDKGGSHDEILELNRNFEVVLKHVES